MILSRVGVCASLMRQVLDWMIGFNDALYIQVRTTGNYNTTAIFTREVFFSLPNSFLANSEDSAHFNSSDSKLADWCLETGLDSTQLQKTQPLCCWEGVFTVLLHSNGRYSIVACIFIAAGMCLLSPCLVMNVCSLFAVLAFRCRVTILMILFTT
jgi:hypothetical protein